MPRRPDYGKEGKPIQVFANYFKLQTNVELTKPEVTLYRYAVSFEETLSKVVCRRAVERVLSDSRFKNVHYATDYSGTIVTTVPVKVSPDGAWEDAVDAPVPLDQSVSALSVKDDDNKTKKAERKFKVQLTGEFQPSQLLQYLRGQPGAAAKDEIIQILNIVVASFASRKESVVRVGAGNKFFDTESADTCELGAGLVALRGFYASVRPSTGRILINLNVAHGVFFQPLPLIDFVHLTGAKGLRLLKVDTTHLGYKKVKTVLGLGTKNARQETFERDGKKVSVYDYFKTQYKITLKYDKEPLVNVGTREKPVYLPMELCKVRPGQPVQKLLGADQASKMILFSARAPSANALGIRTSGLDMYDLNKPEKLDIFGLNLSQQMLTVPARVLRQPNVQYKTGAAMPRDGSWNMAGKMFVRGVTFPKWAIVEVAASITKETMFAMRDVFKEYGVTFGGMPARFPIDARPSERDSLEEKLKQTFAKVANVANVVLFVLGWQDRWLYSRIKFLGDVVFGVHTVCCLDKKLSNERGQQMYLANVALKFNIKGGGINQTVPNVVDADTMLVGVDVTHPAPGSSANAPSVAGVVANCDKWLAQWPASVRRQAGRTEMVAGLAEMIGERLELFRKRNGKLPTKVIVFRDGVSEGQFNLVIEHELPAFRAAFDKYYGANQPKMTIVVVSKRHHTRFYPCRPDEAQGRNLNTAPGTIVDRGVTDPYLFDFFLQAHAGLQGSVRPARYIVIFDQLGWTSDRLSKFIHELCYMFNRATKAVSVCPPAYYADLVCDRARLYLYKAFYEADSDKSSMGSGADDWSNSVHPRLRESTFYI